MKKLGKKCLAYLLVFALLLLYIPVIPISAAGTSGNWSDYTTTVNVGNITINSASELAGFAARVNAGNNYSGYTVTLGADIDLSDHYWIPIGTTASYIFSGTFLGNGHTISGMNINATSYYYLGLFGCTSSSSIRDLTVGGNIQTTVAYSASYPNLYVGGLAGYTHSTLINCVSNVSVNLTSGDTTIYTGSLTGYSDPGNSGFYDLIDCSATGAVTVRSTYPTGTCYIIAGGLSGDIMTQAYSCSATGNVTASGTSTQLYISEGGLVGKHNPSDTTYYAVSNCWATGTVNSSEPSNYVYAGGLEGQAANVNNCYCTGAVNVTGTTSYAYVGGLVGAVQKSIANSYSTGKVSSIPGSAKTGTAGFVGNVQSGATVVNGYYLYDTTTGYCNSAGSGINAGTITSLTGLTADQLACKANISADHTAGTCPYVGQTLTAALNAGAKTVWESKVWVDGTASPTYAPYWSDPGNYSMAVETASASNITINTAADLAGLALSVRSGRSYSGCTVTLGADIDLSGKYWAPIGALYGQWFYGSFDGANHTVSNINVQNEQYAGLFGLCNGGSNTFKNVKVSGTATGLDAGGLVGEFIMAASNTLTTSRCRSSVTVTGLPGSDGLIGSAGGLFGIIYSSVNASTVTIDNCSATGAVSSLGANGYTGGFAGAVYSPFYGLPCTISNCYARGDVSVDSATSDTSIGGFIGHMVEQSAGITVTNCYATGNVTCKSSTITGTNNYLNEGGFVGRSYSIALNNNYSKGSVTVTSGTSNIQNRVGGFIGKVESSALTNNYYPYNAQTSNNTAGYGGQSSASISNMTGLTASQFTNSSNITPTYSVGGYPYNGQTIIAALNSGKPAGGNTWAKTADNGGYPVYDSGSWDNPEYYKVMLVNTNLTINTAAELAGFMVNVNAGNNYSGYTINLGADIDLSDHNWVPIGSCAANGNYYFAGKFLGNNHKITGMNETTNGLTYSGLFGFITGGGSVRDLSVAGQVTATSSTANVYAGGLAGLSSISSGPTCINCKSSVAVTLTNSGSTNAYAGSLCGYLNVNGSFCGINCSATGAVSLTATNTTYCYAGGLTGCNCTKLYNCNASGNITVSHSNGGNGNTYVGGLTGLNSGTITSCWSTGNASCNSAVNTIFAGGFVGQSSGGNGIFGCYSKGSVTVTGTTVGVYTGGFAGNGNTIVTSYSMGTVNSITAGTAYVAGFVGRSDSNTIGCYYLDNGMIGGNGTIQSAFGLTVNQLNNVDVLPGICPYAGKTLTDALNADSNIYNKDTKVWKSAGANPVFCGYWSDEGNYDKTIANAAPANLTIDTPQKLAGFALALMGGADYSSSTVTVAKNIDLSGYYWLPICYSGTSYSGTFNGNGNTISNINVQNASNGGLFGQVDNPAATSIINVKVTGTVSGSQCGGLIGYLNTSTSNVSTVSGCKSAVSVSGISVSSTNYIGGLIGYCNIGGSGSLTQTITNCSATGNVSGVCNGGNFGGLLGHTYCGGSNCFAITNCYATGNVSVANASATGNGFNLGGFLGSSNAEPQAYEKNCYATGNVALTANTNPTAAAIMGGFCGVLNYYTTTNCYSKGTVTAVGTSSNYKLGGFMGTSGSSAVTNECFFLYNAVSGNTTGYVTVSGATVTDLYGLTPDQFQNNTTITNTYGSGHSTYNNTYLLATLNNNKGSNGFSWAKTSLNDGYPVFSLGKWTDTGNFDTTIASAAPANLTITTPSQLAGLAVAININNKDYTGYTVTLAANLDLSGYLWTPIGNSTPFKGTFDGAGYTISSMNVTNTATDSPYAGLFGKTSGAAIKNLKLTSGGVGDTQSTANVYAGALAGYALNTSVTNCTANVSVAATETGSYTAMSGGLIGYYTNTAANSLVDCTASGNVSVSGVSSGDVGGLIGNATVTAGNVNRCHASGNVTGSVSDTAAGALRMGGLLGTTDNLSILNSDAAGAVTSASATSAKRAGGFVGSLGTNAKINNSYATGAVTLTGTTASEFAGGFVGDNSGTIQNTYSSGIPSSVTAAKKGGFAGNNTSTGILTDNYFFYNSTPGCGANASTVTNLTGLTADQLKGNTTITADNTYSGTCTYAGKSSIYALNTSADALTGANKWAVSSSKNGGYPVLINSHWTDDGNYDTTIALAAPSDLTITKASQLAGLAVAVNLNGKDYTGYTVTLGANFSISDSIWVPIGTAANPFTGTFNGANYTISGMNAQVNGSPTGLFGQTSGATFKNVTLSSGMVKTDALYAGALVGYAYNTNVTNCKTTDMTVTDNATGACNVGGLIGYYTADTASYSISGCTSGSTVTVNGAGNSNVGGLIGCLNSSVVTPVTGCTASGSVTGAVTAATYDIDAGGLFGQASGVSALNCSASGAVASNSASNNRYTGGFVGLLGGSGSGISNSYATGAVSLLGNASHEYAGGFVGNNTASVQNCYETGAITYVAGTNTGSFAGVNTAALSNCYYVSSGTIKGCDSNTGTLTNLTGLTAAQLQGTGTISDSTNTYNGKGIVYALDMGIAAIPNAKAWKTVSSLNSGYPVYNDFTVFFMDSGSSTVYGVTGADNGAKITAITDPTKPGFIFGGWYKETACLTPWNFSNNSVAANTTLYAKWSPSTLALANAALADGTYNTAYNQTIAATGNSGAVAYTITAGALPDGLSMSAAGAVTGTPTKVGSYSVTVKATEASTGSSVTAVITIKINTAGTVAVPVAGLPAGGVEKGDTITLTSASTGATIYYTTDGTTPTTSSTVYTTAIAITADTTVKAYAVMTGYTDSAVVTYAYTVNKHTVTYNIGTVTSGTAPTDSAKYVKGDTVTASALGTVTKTGYTFGGWSLNADGSGTLYQGADTLTMGGADMTLYAKWNTVPVALPGGALADGTYNTAYSQNVTATGGSGTFTYTVSGGALPTGLTMSADGKISGTPTVFGSFTFIVKAADSTNKEINAAAYSIKINSLGKVADPIASISAGKVEKGDTVVLTTATSGATIYYTTDGTTPTTASTKYTGAITITANTTVTAIAVKTGYEDSTLSSYAYIVNQHSVTYNVGTVTGGTAPADTTVYGKGDTVTAKALGSVTKSGYTFGGWSLNADGSGTSYNAADTLTMGASNDVLYAIWAPIPVTLTGAALADGTYGTAYSQAVTAAGGSGTFTYSVTGGALPAGLIMAANGTITGTPAAFGNFTITVKATDSKNGQTATADFTLKISSLGTASAPTSDADAGAIDKGTGVSLSSTTPDALIYYTTDGSDPTTSSTLYTGPITISADVTIKAIAIKAGWAASTASSFAYTVKYYTVTFDPAGGTTVASTTLANGSKITKPADPVLVNYVFGGWYTDNTYITPWNFDTDTINKANVTLVAKWYRLGDINMDGTVNSLDVRLAMKAIAGSQTLTDLQKKICDVNGNGAINSIDSRIIMQISAGIIK